ncbi:MAG: hypothetical protein KatS3mg035_0583 [Bacteroidia bacterium]|nr:MAG: hypothetical protein KatS3mg035_0583 [Bacteroidia bacterium]
MLIPKILFENRDFIIVYKPHGLNTDQDKQGNPSLESWLSSYYQRKIFLAHRLDRPVSGLLLATKKKSILQFIQENWKNFQKKYYALVEGNIHPDESLLSHYHYKDLKNFKAIIDSESRKNFQICSLKYQKVKESSDFSWIEVELITGKYHQIRAQLAYIGHPIVGDQLYGSRFLLKNPFPKIALSAYHLSFYYPNKNDAFQFEYLPDDEIWNLSKLFKNLNLS